MTKNITADFIQSHSLMDCLREFDGAHSEGDKAKVEELNGIFYLLAQKMLYGGYFAVYKASEFDYYLYYIPKLLHDNFIKLFES